MKCPKCKGEGQIIKKEKGTIGYIARLGICDKCHGSGEVEMTNEEYIRSCSTEELAKLLYTIGFYDNITDHVFNEIAMMQNLPTEQAFEVWLKEKHDDGNASTN